MGHGVAPLPGVRRTVEPLWEPGGRCDDRSMRALAQDDEERVAFWRRHTVSGIVLCEVIPAIIAVRTVTTVSPRAGLVLALAAAVAGSAPLLALIPVDRLGRHPWGRLFFDAAGTRVRA